MNFVKILAISLIGLSLQACAVGGAPREDHAIAFDIHSDSPDFVIWDYRYSQSGVLIRGPGDYINTPGYTGQGQSGARGNMLIGDTLYVKWKDRKTGEKHEETASLVGRLPRDMQDKSIRFIVSAKGLHIYVAGSNFKPLKINDCPRLNEESRADTAPDKQALAYFCANSLIKIYPEQKTLIPEQK